MGTGIPSFLIKGKIINYWHEDPNWLSVFYSTRTFLTRILFFMSFVKEACVNQSSDNEPPHSKTVSLGNDFLPL